MFLAAWHRPDTLGASRAPHAYGWTIQGDKETGRDTGREGVDIVYLTLRLSTGNKVVK